MKILILLKSSYPRGMALTKRIHLYAKGLTELGNTVEIIIPKPTEKPKHINNYHISGEFDGVNYRYTSKSTIRSICFIKRRFCDISALVQSFVYCIQKKPNIVLYAGNDIIDILLFKLASLISGSKFIREKSEVPYFHKVALNKYDKFKIKCLYSLADGIIVISNNLKNYFQKDFSITTKYITVPIISRINSESQTFASISKNLVYTGSLSQHKDGVLTIIESFARIMKEHKGLRLIMTGNLDNSPDNKDILNLVKKYSLENHIEFTGFITEEKLNYLVNTALVLLFAKPNNRQNKYNSATKIAEYLMSRRPILITDVDESCEYLESRTSAFISKPDINSYTKELEYILTNPKKANIVGVKGREVAIHNFNYFEQTKKLNSFFKSF